MGDVRLTIVSHEDRRTCAELIRRRPCLLMIGAALVAILSASVAHTAEGPPGQPPAPLKVGMVSRTFFYVPFWAAQRQGFFAQEGLRVEGIIFDSASKVNGGTREGSLDIGIGTPEGAIQDVEAGGPLRIVAGNANKLTHSLIALKKYRRIEDLRGAVLGVASLDEGTAFIMHEMMARHGLMFPRDYMLKAVGGAPARWKALQEGTIDAGLQAIPLNYIAEDAGYPNLGDATAYVPHYQFTTINIRRDGGARQGDAVVRFLKAMIRGTRWLYANREAAVALTAEEMRIGPKDAERGWRDFTSQQILPSDLGVSLPGMTKVIEIMGRAGFLRPVPETRPERYLDLSFLSRARETLGAP